MKTESLLIENWESSFWEQSRIDMHVILMCVSPGLLGFWPSALVLGVERPRFGESNGFTAFESVPWNSSM